MRRALYVLFVGVMLCLSSPVARAQPKQDPEAQKQEEARRSFEEAEKLYNIGDYEAALEGYKKAYLLSNSPELLFNMGQCYRKLGKYDDALITYRSYLREVPDSSAKADVEARIAEVEKEKANPKFSKVVISSNPTGAQVHKGGSTSRIIGVTPFTVGGLTAGEYVFTLTSPGFEPFEINLVTEGGKDYVIPEAKLRKEKKLKPDWAYYLTAGGEFFNSADITGGSKNFTTGLASFSVERFSQDQRASYGLEIGGDFVRVGYALGQLTFWRHFRKRPIWSLGYGGSVGVFGGNAGDFEISIAQLHGRLRVMREGEYRGALSIELLDAGVGLGAPNSFDFSALGLGYSWGLRKRE